MRIISGKFKARRIVPPNNLAARPTTDFAKEGLFNLLNNRIDYEEVTALDLFAGTGSISLELASRECKQITTVDINERHCAFIRKVCDDLKIDNLLLVRADVFKYIEKLKFQYDLIFADPPYDLPRLTELPDMIFSRSLLNEDGMFILEHSAKYNFESHPNFDEHRKYGNVNFSFFSNR